MPTYTKQFYNFQGTSYRMSYTSFRAYGVKKAFSLPWLSDQFPLEASMTEMHTFTPLQGVL